MRLKKCLLNTFLWFIGIGLSISTHFINSNAHALSNAVDITEKSLSLKTENDDNLKTIFFNDGSYAKVGTIYNETTSGNEINVSKYTATGDLEWSNENIVIAGAEAGIKDCKMIETSVAPYLFAFTGISSSSKTSAFYIGFDESGNELWRNSFNQSGYVYVVDLYEDYDIGVTLQVVINNSLYEETVKNFLFLQILDDGDWYDYNVSYEMGIQPTQLEVINVLPVNNEYHAFTVNMNDFGDTYSGAVLIVDSGFGSGSHFSIIDEGKNSHILYTSSACLPDSTNFVLGVKSGNEISLRLYDISNESLMWEKTIDVPLSGLDNDNYISDIFINENTNTVTSLVKIEAYHRDDSRTDYDIAIFEHNLNTGELISTKYYGGTGNEEILNSQLLSNGDLLIELETTSKDIPMLKGFTGKSTILYSSTNESIASQINNICNANEVDTTALNQIYNGLSKSLFKSMVNDVIYYLSNLPTEPLASTANLDIYITCENILTMSLSTNYITFEDFSMAEDTIKERALKITVNSTLPYQLNAYLESEIQNSDGSSVLNKEILNIKESSSSTYQYFPQVKEKVVLANDCNAGEDIVHNIDFKLKGGYDYKVDVYKTAIKFEIEQK